MSKDSDLPFAVQKSYLAIMIRIVFLFSIAFLIHSIPGNAQEVQGILHSGQKTGQSPFPVESFDELPNPVSTQPEWWTGKKPYLAGWGSKDIRYKKERPAEPRSLKKTINLYAWKGERVSAQWVVSAFDEPLTLTYEISDLVHKKDRRTKISDENFLTGFVRYVMTDELNKDGKGSCGHRINSDFDSTLVADMIDHRAEELNIPARSTRPGWIRIWVPEDAKEGKYEGTVILKGNGKILEELSLVLEVAPRVLPDPGQWGFHLDLWQSPYAVARYYNLEPWSEEHFDQMREDMKHYAQAGGDVITASITHKPWNGQTHDYFETMVTWMKKADGTWFFDYTIFDKWVEFMMEMGVDKQINCYSMIPWRLSFQYYDQATNQLKFVETEPGEETYSEMWGAMLTSFAAHLKEKGWFEKTYIAMDERPMEAMKETLKVIRSADKDFNISLAGDLYPELLDDIGDYCVPYYRDFTPEMLEKRKEKGQISTYYTSCSQSYPNTFTFNPPAESEFLGWFTASQNLDGFLRWAYNSWVLEPLLDSRFITWAAGDTYFVYPGGRTSLRFERLVEGIQKYEKIQILKKELKAKGDEKGLKKIDEILATFQNYDPEKESAASLIHKADQALQNF